MSTMLQDAIVDAEALKEAALKNAETMIIEKYSEEVKNSLNTILEQELPPEEEAAAMDALAGGGLPPEAAAAGPEAALGMDPGMDPMAGMDPTMAMPQEAPPAGEEQFPEVPMGAVEGEKLCGKITPEQTLEVSACPEEDEEVEINFSDLAAEMGRQEGEEAGDMMNREEEIIPQVVQEEVELEEEALLSLFEQIAGGEEINFAYDPNEPGMNITGDPSPGIEEINFAYDPNEPGMNITGDPEMVDFEIDPLDIVSTQDTRARAGLQLPGDPTSASWEQALAKDRANQGGFLGGLRGAYGLEEEVSLDIATENAQDWAGMPTALKEEGEEIALAHEALADADQKNEALVRHLASLQEAYNKSLEENEKYKGLALKLKDKLEEVNLSNAKLLYKNRVLDNTSLNERQKNKIAETISNSKTVEEAKVVFETLQSTVESVSGRKAPKSLSEAVQRNSSATFPRRNVGNQVSASPETNRWKTLAGISKNNHSDS